MRNGAGKPDTRLRHFLARQPRMTTITLAKIRFGAGVEIINPGRPQAAKRAPPPPAPSYPPS
jgi:hypothetical protein